MDAGQKPSELWKGVSRSDFNRYQFHVNPAGKLVDYKAWREANPDVQLPTIPKQVPAGAQGASSTAAEDAQEEEPQIPGFFPRKLPTKFKSHELRAIETSTKIGQGRPGFALYKRHAGKYWYIGTIDSPSYEAVATEYGGGSFEVRLIIDGYEDPTKTFPLDIHPGKYPEQYAIVPQNQAPMQQGMAAQGQSFTTKDLEEVAAKAKREALLEMTIQNLERRVAAGGEGATQARGELDQLQKFLEIWKAMQPPVSIGPAAKSAVEMLNESVGMITAVSQLTDRFKGGEEKSSGISGRLLDKALDVLPEIMRNRQDPGGQVQPAPQQPSQGGRPSEMDMKKMYEELAMEIGKQQGIEISSSAVEAERSDTTVAMASWILAQHGLPWTMLLTLIRQSPIDNIVKQIEEQMPPLADSAYKKLWLAQVIEAVKDPKLLGKR